MTARIAGTADEIRGLVPAARESWRRINDDVLDRGVADQRIKELCFRYLADGPAVTDSAALGERERAALDWASDRAGDELWARLHRHFTEPELVDLGCAIGFELGQQHWRRSVGLRARG